MPRVLLALSDLGLGVQLQEALEARGVVVAWDQAAAEGPGAEPVAEDVVVLDADSLGDRLAEVADAWRRLDPPPALVALGATAGAATSAAAARVRLVAASDDAATFLRAADEATRLRFTGSLSRAIARRALQLTASPDPTADAAQIVGAARGLDVGIAREALRWHARSYVCAHPDVIAALRHVRALTIPEVEFVGHLDGTLTVQALVKQGPIDGYGAARLIWALTSAGAATISPEPYDLATPRRRALAMARRHLRARQARLERGTFYDVLEITPAADTDEVERAYALVARRFSPQALGGHDLADLAGVPEAMWAQVEKARAVMHDIAARGRYNDWLRSRWSEIRTRWTVETDAAQAAAEMFARGQRALGAGDVHRAVGDLAGAARNHPGHPDYEANLAWARWRAASARADVDRAEALRRELAAAEDAVLGCRPWPRAQLALALLYATSGDPDSARWHLQDALATDPNLPAAQQLLARLGQR